MPATEGMNELAEKKRVLILQADLHRALLQAECAKARERLDAVNVIRAKFLSHPWLIAGGAVAAVLAVGRWRGALKWVPTALSAWRWINKLKLG